MAYIGNDPSNRFVAPKAASVFSGDGSTTAFTLDHAVGSDEDILVSVDGVIQEPSVAYAVSSGTTLTFTAAPSSNSGNNIFVYYLFRTVGTVSHPSNNALTATNGTLTGTLDVTGASTLTGALSAKGGAVFNEDSADVDFRVESNGNANMLLVDGGNDAVVVGQSAADTTVIGTTPPLQVIGSGGNSFITVTNRQASDSGPHIALTKSRNTSVGSHTIVQSGDTVGAIVFQADDGTNLDSRAAEIRCKIDDTPGENDVPGRLEFLTTADGANSPTERLRIGDTGHVLFHGITGRADSSSGHMSITDQSNNRSFLETGTTTTSAMNLMVFINSNGAVGTITTSGSSTAFNTSSDYRLKENVSYDFDATTRLKQLKPARFNFIADADTTVDGFLAHEVQSVVPQAITGTHNEVEVWEEDEELPDGVSVGDNKLDDDGNTIPIYQSIDQSKLVPLLVKSLQEALTEIDTLKTKVAALESK